MLRHMLLISAVLYAGLLLPSVVKADALADARKAITAAYAREDAAIGRKDIKGVTEYYTSDFIDIDEKGHKSDLAATKQEMQTVFQMAQSIKLQQRVITIVLHGNRATVTGTASMEGLISDSSKRSHKLHRLVTAGSFIDTWVKSKRGWLKKQSRSLYARTTVDNQSANSL